jgi:hypothetical protein
MEENLNCSQSCQVRHAVEAGLRCLKKFPHFGRSARGGTFIAPVSGPPDLARTALSIELAEQNSKRQSAEMVRPFHGFGHMPDQENFFNGLRHRHGSGNQNQTGTVVAGDKLTEMPRHRADIMRVRGCAKTYFRNNSMTC